MNDKHLESALQELPGHLKREVFDFIEFLKYKYYETDGAKNLKFDWEGGLADIAGSPTSVELQHKSLEWR